MFVRRKVVKGETYYQVVEGYRDEQGRVRHRTVVSLGRSATLGEAVAVFRKELRRLRGRLALIEPLAGYAKPLGREADALRARIASLTQRTERLQALQKRAKA